MMHRWLVLIRTFAVSILALAISTSAYADETVEPSDDPFDPGVETGVSEEEEGVDSSGEVEPIAGDANDYAWTLYCFGNYPGVQNEMCAAAQACPDEDELLWLLWQKPQDAAEAAWQDIGSTCLGATPEGAPPVVTDGDVLNAVRRLGLPRLTVQVQPAEETLVNFETIFYANEPQWVRTVTLLGYTVEIEAEVTSYSWLFGDGTTTSTTTPGAPYPAKDVVHEYTDAHVRMQPRVDVAYEITYRVDGGVWQTIDETVPAQGYATELLIREATPILVGD